MANAICTGACLHCLSSIVMKCLKLSLVVSAYVVDVCSENKNLIHLVDGTVKNPERLFP
jgi:hypothetical protein